MNTNETVEKFVSYLNRRYSERSTAKHYKSDLMIFQQTVENNRWEEISHKDVDQFVEKQHETGMSPATINRRLASLHTFFEWWAGEEPEKNKANPVLWRRHKIKESELMPRDASDDDVERLFAVIESPRDRAIFGVMVGAGLRVSEVANLKQKALTPPPTPEQMAQLRVWGKGKKERMAWLTPKLYTQIADWQRVRPSQTEDDHLFLNQHKRGLSKDGIQYLLRSYCHIAGIDITCHQLRHTFARRLAEQRMPVEAIAQVLGHNQVETTQRYINGADVNLRDHFQAVMAQLEAKPDPTPSALELPRLPSTPPVTEQADSAHLKLALARFDSLPDWLRTTLCDYLGYRWRSWKAHMAAEHVHRLSRQLLLTWRWLLDNRSLSAWTDLQRTDIELWMTTRLADGVVASSLRTMLCDLLTFLRFAIDQDLPVSAQLLRVAYPQVPAPLPLALSEQDYLALVQTVLAETNASTLTSLQERAWFLTLAHTGLRVSELLNLRLNDLDLRGQRLYIRNPKNSKERVLFMTPSLHHALVAYLAQRPASTDNHLWLLAGAPLKAHQIRYRLSAWGKLAKVHVSPHLLRHTLATRLINQDMPLLSVSKLLGHDSLHATQRYAHLYDSTVHHHFQTAVSHIDGIPVSDWPASTTHSVTLLADSV